MGPRDPNDRIHYLDQLGESLDDAIRPIADLGDIGVDDMLDAAPPDREWLIPGFLPLAIVGLLAAIGGAGKSFWMLLLGVSIATGRPFLGMDVSEPGAVLIIAAEDERQEVHRRLWRILQTMRDDGELTDLDTQRLRKNLFILSRVGLDNRLTAQADRIVEGTGRAEAIALLAQQIPNIKLVVLDPVSRFRGGEENSNEGATRFVEEVESLRTATGATVLLPHHVNKNSMANATENLTIDGLRGASALVDGVRWAAAMAPMRKDVAEEYGVDPERAGYFVRCDTVKTSYSQPWPGMWLERVRGGVLVPAHIERAASSQAKRGDSRYRELLPRLTGLVEQMQEQGKPLSPSKLRKYSGREGHFGVGDQTLRSVLERAVAEGHVKEHESGNGVVLRTW